MNPELAVELYFFGVCILWGGLVLLAYDFLRIIRRLIKHGILLLAVEDIIFWIAAGIFIFAMIYRQNNGIIRGFAVMGMSAGMLLYNRLVRDRLVNIIVKLIRLLIKPFVLAISLIKKCLALVGKRLQNILKLLLKRLKSVFKSIKMRVSRKQNAFLQKHLQKRQQRQKKRRQAKQERRAANKRNRKKLANGADDTNKAGKTGKANEAKKAYKANGVKPGKSAAGRIEESRGAFDKDNNIIRIHKKEPVFSRLTEEELRQILNRRK